MNSVFFSKNQLYLFIVLFACLVSRIVSTIYYIEDIDSLRFALSLYDYNLSNLQPHFPGYPVFCFFAKIIYLTIPSMGITFSIIGAISTFIIIYFSLRLGNTEIKSPEGAFMSLIIFFNPMIWLMGNRYMPDLMGLALVSAILYLFILPQTNKNNLFAGYFFTGVLLGTRLSYFPLIIIPFFKNLQEGFSFKKIAFFLLGIIIWLLPLLFFEGFESLIVSAKKQTVGHFTEFGGTAITENNWANRLLYTIESIWSDGLGGYWIQRSWQTLFFSFFLISLIVIGTFTIVKNWRYEKYLRRIIRCIILYFLWVLFFQNVIYKSRHVLPILLLFFIIIVIGIEFVLKKKSKLLNAITMIFLFSLVQITSNIVRDHKKPVAISQLKDDLINSSSRKTIVSTPLINFYLQTHDIDASYINVLKQDQINELLNSASKKDILIVGNFTNIFSEKYNIIQSKTYYHNPYVNRMWSKIETFSVSNNK